ncbi:MAG: hypothetical protein M0Z39_09290 [Actinomycetota bacterium]|jgi:hypothetical protein|nr:hypothetical protein [Actinomycetota bacterium]
MERSESAIRLRNDVELSAITASDGKKAVTVSQETFFSLISDVSL